MAVYNGERFIREAVDSVLSQTYTDWELLLADDGSSDSSREIAAEYAAKDARIRPIQSSHLGPGGVRNFGATHARADLLSILDCDDAMESTCLALQLHFLGEHPEASIVCCWARMVNVDGKEIGRSNYPVNVEEGMKTADATLFLEIVHSGSIIKRSVFEKLGGYRRDLGLEDRDLWGRAVTSGFMIRCNEQFLVRYRLHGKSFSVGAATIEDDLSGVNIVRRLRGEPELSGLEYRQWLAARPISEKIIEWQRRIAMRAFKAATRDFAEHRLIDVACHLALAGVVRPIWTIERVLRKRRGQ